jgi:hypothetical protein
LISGKEIEEDIDLDEDIEIPKLYFDNTTIDQMRLVSQLLQKKAKQKQLREERDREFRIIESAKNILTESIGVDVDSSQHILLKLEEVVRKFNEDSSGQNKLIEKVENKFDNKVLEHIAQQITI